MTGIVGDAPADKRQQARRRLRRIGIAAGVLAVLLAPFWGPLLLRQFTFFRVRRVEILGARYVAPSEVLERLSVDTTASVWDPTGPLAARVGAHPEVRHAEITRRLPGTLVVRVFEHIPVALLPGPEGFTAYDAFGRALPIDLTRVRVDAPVLVERDSMLLALLGALRTGMPSLYNRLSEVRRGSRDDIVLRFVTGPPSVRAMAGVSLERLAEVELVERDLERRQLRATELDLRYRDQVIARLP